MMNRKIILAVMIFVVFVFSAAYASNECHVGGAGCGGAGCIKKGDCDGCSCGECSGMFPNNCWDQKISCPGYMKVKWWQNCDYGLDGCLSCGGWHLECVKDDASCPGYCSYGTGTYDAQPDNTCTVSIDGYGSISYTCYMNYLINGKTCVYSSTYGNSAACCSSGNCTNSVCCSEKDCSKSANVKMNPAGTGKCDGLVNSAYDSVYCGTPTCAGGNSSARVGFVKILPGNCGCINDNPTKFFDSGEMQTATVLSNPYGVYWYNITLLGTGLGAVSSEKTHVVYDYYEDGYSAPDASDDIRSSDTPTMLIYPGIKTAKALSLYINLATDDDSQTPNVTGATARMLPRLNNYVQGLGQKECWPVRQNVNCDIDGKVGSIKPCSGGDKNKALSAVEARLNDGSYRETTLLDNFRNFVDINWCVDPTNKKYREGATPPGSCDDNSDCPQGCCSNTVCDIVQTTMDGEGHIVMVPSKNPVGGLCGGTKGAYCTNSTQCSTGCCHNESFVDKNKCVYLDVSDPYHTKGCIN